MYLRAVCANRILWGVEQKKEITFRHSQNAPGRFLREARPMLANFAQANTAAVVAGVEAAKAPVLPDERKDKIAWIMKHANVTQVRAVAALNAVEREEHRICRSVWDVAQGLTAVARRIPHQDQRVDLERAAKRILDKVA
jgi:hydroxypyruvate isomerase